MDSHEVTLTVENRTVTASPQLPIVTPSGKELLLLKIKDLREIRLVVGPPKPGEPTPKTKITVFDENGLLSWANQDDLGVNIDPPPPPIGISRP